MDDTTLKTVSIDGLEEIGRGATSRVFKLDEDKIIKVFHPWIQREEIERERSASRRAFIKGVPTAITYHLVKAGEGYGIIYELIDADTLAMAMYKDRDHLKEYATKAAGMLRTLHATEYEKGQLPDTRDVWCNMFDMALNRFLTEEQRMSLKSFIRSLPERHTFIHGDFHALNIMVRRGELILIDVGDASLGDPVLDLAGTYMASVIVASQSVAEHTKKLLLSAEEWQEFWDAFLMAYLKTEDPKALSKETERIAYFALIRQAATCALLPGMEDEEKRLVLAPKIRQIFEKMGTL